ncbi:type II toxin-antitoxin system RelE/ParE family toxin [Candidatus Saganbacteria bacterium]|nr:type II toxin-antitoxin system RelE/ParE family toxin [Candidatus Saganbacteria bacterium]
MPSKYDVLFTNQAKKELSKIQRGSPKDAKSIFNSIIELSNNPSIGKFLHGDLKGRRKLRVGDYRVIYKTEHKELIVYIVRIAHRKEVYR